MRTRNLLLRLGGACAILLASGTAQAASLFLDSWGVSYGVWAPANKTSNQQVNVAVEDWTSGGNGYLGPGYGGQDYDCEAAYIGADDSNLYLAIVTGFPLAGRYDSNTGDRYMPGDLAIDVGSDGTYDYAVDVDGNGALRSGNLAWENPSIMGGPAWGHVMDPLRARSWTHTDVISGFRYGTFSGRYSIEAVIDRDLLPSASSYTLHWTMGCGNDGMNIAIQPVPEPSTILLLGAGLVGAAFAYRRRRPQ
jgi:hypothetical protein